MAATMLPLPVPPAEGPSPTPSDTSMASQPAEEVAHRTRSKARRSPSRVALRTGFRNFSGVATVLVGDPDNKLRPETKYLVHKELITSASPFFGAALNSTFAEGMDQVVKLPEEKPEVFEWFLQWLYTGTLKSPVTRSHYATHGPVAPTVHSLTDLTEHDIRTDGDLRNTQGSPKYFLLLDLYALSDRLLTTPLSNHILSTIARLSESTNSVPTPSDTWILYDSIRENSTLRMLILDLFAYKKTDRLLETHKDEWHPKFLRELCVKLKRPGPEAIERHALVAWRPSNWSTSKACELCKDVLQPGVSGDKCCACEKVFCGACLRTHGKGGAVLPNDTSGSGTGHNNKDLAWLRPCPEASSTSKDLGQRCSDITTERQVVPRRCPTCNISQQNFVAPEYQQFKLQSEAIRKRFRPIKYRRRYSAVSEDDEHEMQSDDEESRGGYDLEAEAEAWAALEELTGSMEETSAITEDSDYGECSDNEEDERSDDEESRGDFDLEAEAKAWAALMELSGEVEADV